MRSDLKLTLPSSSPQAHPVNRGTMHAQRGPNATPAAAAGASSGRAAESFVEWASTQRRRAALDGAWKVQVTERLLPNGGCIGSVVTWHDNAGQPSTPVRRGRQQGGDVPGQPEEQASSSNSPQRQSARQRRSALRSTAHHKLKRRRVLRGLWHAVRFLVRLSRLSAATRVLRDGPPPGKRRLSPPPEQEHLLLRPASSCSSDDDNVALLSSPKRPELGRLSRLRQVVSRAVFGDG